MPTNPAVDIAPLAASWRLVRSQPFAAADPSAVDWSDAIADAVVPGTVASTLCRGQLDSKSAPVEFDDFDWWYECQFDGPAMDCQSALLRLGGLATIAEVWLNGTSVHTSRNMFRAFELNLRSSLQRKNTLTIVFRSLNHDLGTRRPRGRWKTNLVRQQQLRWIRTTLLGRIPGWTPPIAPVGPWRDVQLVQGRHFGIDQSNVCASLSGTTGQARIDIRLRDIAHEISIDTAAVKIGGHEAALTIERNDDRASIDGAIAIEDAGLWYPHTHGVPQLHDFSVDIGTNLGDLTIANGRIGFRTVEVDRSDGRLAFVINGKTVFARGGCWSTNDIVSLAGSPEKLRQSLQHLRDSGTNMVRVGGTMVYESDYFYSLCDELGIAVWQDFMFANMDYPIDDAEFRHDVDAEISGEIRRLRPHPSIVAFCGNSEVEQQAAMFGMTEDVWRNALFYEHLPEAVESLAPGTPYFPSSPCEGALPFDNSIGPAHYFGVGAYLQDFDDLRKSAVSFASECLAFSNVPSDRALQRHFGSTLPAAHHPDWKSGVPRDSAAGWDFEDVRDHYIGALYGVDPVKLRYADRERYIAISQVVTGEVMDRVYSYWRDHATRCQGGLLWFLNDIVPGAGWGLLDSDGQPKPLLHFLRRSWAPVSLPIADTGMNGLDVRVVNETDKQFDATLRVMLLQNSRIAIADVSRDVSIAANDTTRFGIDAMLGRFFDSAYRYRFGPPKHNVVLATLTAADQKDPLTACYYPGSHNIEALEHAEVSINCQSTDNESVVTLVSDAFLKHVRLHSSTHEFSDNYFELPPSTERTVTAVRCTESQRAFKGQLSALNLSSPIAFR